jgi:hypothetical protein
MAINNTEWVEYKIVGARKEYSELKYLEGFIPN